MQLRHENKRQICSAVVIWQRSSCYCEMNINLVSERSVIYMACWCNTTVAFMLRWLGHERQGQMWPAEVIWRWSSCYCDMNVSGRCDLLNKSYDSELHVTVTCWYYITRQFILLWQTHTRQRYIGPAAVIWLWSPCCWNWGWNQYSRTDLECFCFVSFSQTTHLIIISK